MSRFPCTMISAAAIVLFAGQSWSEDGAGQEKAGMVEQAEKAVKVGVDRKAPPAMEEITVEGVVEMKEVVKAGHGKKEGEAPKEAPKTVKTYAVKTADGALVVVPARGAKGVDGKELKVEDFVGKKVKIVGKGKKEKAAVVIRQITSIEEAK